MIYMIGSHLIDHQLKNVNHCDSSHLKLYFRPTCLLFESTMGPALMKILCWCFF